VDGGNASHSADSGTGFPSWELVCRRRANPSPSAPVKPRASPRGFRFPALAATSRSHGPSRNATAPHSISLQATILDTKIFDGQIYKGAEFGLGLHASGEVEVQTLGFAEKS
jgi:hypothetical protein